MRHHVGQRAVVDGGERSARAGHKPGDASSAERLHNAVECEQMADHLSSRQRRLMNSPTAIDGSRNRSFLPGHLMRWMKRSRASKPC
jgi:hypothetical protein